MALTTRGKAFVAAAGIVAVLGGGVAALVLDGDNPVAKAIDSLPGIADAPTPCPLTNEPVGKDKEPPARPALAVKVENTPEALPLVGLDKADVVYEEVVEGGITRFVVVFNCTSARRVGPVRSARTTDPKLLLQFSEHPLLAYSGGAPKVVRIIKQSGVVGMTEDRPARAFSRDDAREVPHNLFVDTAKLWLAGEKRAEGEPAPEPIFSFGEINEPSKKATSARIEFPLVEVEWRWSGGRWNRYQDSEQMTLEDGSALQTDNVLIQQVKTTESDIIDVIGFPSPEVKVTGKGKAWLLRDGKVVQGRWERASESDVTVFRTKQGDEFQLADGATFVELAPTGMFDAPVTVGR